MFNLNLTDALQRQSDPPGYCALKFALMLPMISVTNYLLS